jgi:hypothetical protein
MLMKWHLSACRTLQCHDFLNHPRPAGRSASGGLVAIAARALTLDLNALPARQEELRIGFGMGVGNNKKPLLLVHPGTGDDYEALHVRYAVYMNLALDGRPVAGNLGQLIVTGQRLVGMMTHGKASDTTLDESVGSVFAFTIGMDDIQQPTAKTRWTGRVAGVVITSRPAQNPAFELAITSVVGVLTDEGGLTYGQSLADLMTSLTLAG